MELKITNIQSYSLHDGPGIRTTIFLAGCPLSCIWCHNPEAKVQKKQLVFDEKKCINCKACEACPSKAHTFEADHKIDRTLCTMCGKCINACKANALAASVRTLSFSKYLDIVDRQRRLIGDNGGITFSGGEPLQQGKVLIDLLDKTSVHKAIETCGFADEELFKDVIKKTDFIMLDIKFVDNELHKKYTGASNESILKNLEHLRNSGKPFVIRTPLIEGITDTKENLSSIEALVNGDKWEKLPYNPLTPAKYQRIGEKYLL